MIHTRLVFVSACLFVLLITQITHAQTTQPVDQKQPTFTATDGKAYQETELLNMLREAETWWLAADTLSRQKSGGLKYLEPIFHHAPKNTDNQMPDYLIMDRLKLVVYRVGPDSTQKLMKMILYAPRVDTRVRAVYALGALGPEGKAAVAILIKLAENLEFEQFDMLSDVLASMGDAAVDPTMKAFQLWLEKAKTERLARYPIIVLGNALVSMPSQDARAMPMMTKFLKEDQRHSFGMITRRLATYSPYDSVAREIMVYQIENTKRRLPHSALSGLGFIDPWDDEISAFLISYIADEHADVLHHVLEALYGRKANPKLIDAIMNLSEEVRHNNAEYIFRTIALQELKDERLYDLALKSATAEAEWHTRSDAILYLSLFTEKKEELKKVADQILLDVAHESLRENTLELWLAMGGDHKRAMKVYEELANDEEGYTLGSVAIAIRDKDLDTEWKRDIYLKAIKHENRYSKLLGLIALRSDDADIEIDVDIILPLVNDRDADVANEAMAYLTSLDRVHQNVLDVLMDQLEFGNREQKVRAAMLLGDQLEMLVGPMIMGLKDYDPYVRAASALGLYHAGYETAKMRDMIEQMINSGDYQLMMAGCNALAHRETWDDWQKALMDQMTKSTVPGISKEARQLKYYFSETE